MKNVSPFAIGVGRDSVVNQNCSGGKGGSPPPDRPILYSLSPSGQDNNPSGHATERCDLLGKSVRRGRSAHLTWVYIRGTVPIN